MPLNASTAARTSNLIARGNAHAHAAQAPGPFDVWTNTAKGMAQNKFEELTDPWGKMSRELDSQMKQVRALVPDQWERTDYEATQEAFIASAEGVGDAAYKLAEAEGGLATAAAAFGVLTSLEQALSVPFSTIPFPAFPAVRITDMAIGLPHAHMHPPNLTPPNPTPVPLPSAGPVIPIPFLSGAGTVSINNLPAARCGDMGLGIWCGGYFPMYEIFLGSSSVWIEGARAARVAIDITKHCIFSTPKPSDPPLGPMTGTTITASPNVSIGGVPLPSLTAMAMGKAFKAVFKGFGKLKALAKGEKVVDQAAARGMLELNHMARNVNPGNGTVNCGKIIDAVLDRLTGRNADAVAPTGRNGAWNAIEARHGTAFQESSFDKAFREVSKGGDGTKALLGIHYANSNASHVVVITNNKGAVGIVEGQGGGAVFSSADAAKAKYGAGSRVTKADL